MRKILSAILIGASVFGGCKGKVEKPNRTDFEGGVAGFSTKTKGLLVAVDCDKDGLVDGIVDHPMNDDPVSLVRYHVPGYEKALKDRGYSLGRSEQMPESVRRAASRVLASVNETDYEMAEAKYQVSTGNADSN